MWPWEHLAVGYLLYSLGLRALGWEPPTDGGVFALAVATQIPDLVDKPLSWGLGWVPSGYALAHSVFIAVPLGVMAYRFARRRGHTRWGVGFAVGYWSHLLADVANPLRSGARALPGRILWPLSDPDPYDVNYGLGRGFVYLEEFLAQLSTLSSAQLLPYVLLPAAGIGLWLLDGAPGLGLVRRVVDGLR